MTSNKYPRYDLSASLLFDGDDYPVTESTTLGRHLDNDLVVAGEDVLDFHLRVEPTDRGLQLHPLGGSTFEVNDRLVDTPLGIINGDVLKVGQNSIVVQIHGTNAQRIQPMVTWQLQASQGSSTIELQDVMMIGREAESDILLMEDHISRQHAQIICDGLVWLRDLGSANGTLVNGQRLSGGQRLHHGDFISFDAITFQLIGKGGDLTPVARFDTPAMTPLTKQASDAPLDTTEISVVDSAPLTELPKSTDTGAFFLGASSPISGRTFRAIMGRSLIGRDMDSDIVINDQTVSARHAEVIVRAEGCTITNLMATNGTRVNGTEIQSAKLEDGDVVRLGRVSLVFKDIPVSVRTAALMDNAKWVLVTGSAILALVLAWFLLR